jgi:fatty-acyl-CoA synthase
MARNHRGFVEATIALSKLGADALYLNTAFAGPQITDVCRREAPAAVIYDEEFAGLCAGALEGRMGIVAWSDGGTAGDPTIEALIAGGNTSDLSPPAQKGRVIILTSGTTGTLEAPPAASPSRWTRPPRSWPGSRCAPASARTSPRRCSTPGASRTSRSG